MKHLLLTTIAAVLVVGCGPSMDIWEAVSKGDIEAVKQHIAAGTDVNANEFELLHRAALGGHKEIVELLIAAGADVNAKDKTRGFTPLHYAAREGRKEIAELLISKGVDVNAKDDYGNTPLDRAIQLKRTETADLLRKHGGKTKRELEAAGN